MDVEEKDKPSGANCQCKFLKIKEQNVSCTREKKGPVPNRMGKVVVDGITEEIMDQITERIHLTYSFYYQH